MLKNFCLFNFLYFLASFCCFLLSLLVISSDSGHCCGTVVSDYLPRETGQYSCWIVLKRLLIFVCGVCLVCIDAKGIVN